MEIFLIVFGIIIFVVIFVWLGKRKQEIIDDNSVHKAMPQEEENRRQINEMSPEERLRFRRDEVQKRLAELQNNGKNSCADVIGGIAGSSSGMADGNRALQQAMDSGDRDSIMATADSAISGMQASARRMEEITRKLKKLTSEKTSLQAELKKIDDELKQFEMSPDDPVQPGSGASGRQSDIEQKKEELRDQQIRIVQDVDKLEFGALPSSEVTMGYTDFITGHYRDACRKISGAVRISFQWDARNEGDDELTVADELVVALRQSGFIDLADQISRIVALERAWLELNAEAKAIKTEESETETEEESPAAGERKDEPGMPKYIQATEALQASGDIRTAISLMEESRKLEPENPLYGNSLAALYAQTGEDARAEELWNSVLLTSPGYEGAVENYATFLCNRGASNDDESQFRKALEVNSSHCNSHRELGIRLQNSGQWEDAIHHLHEAIKNATDPLGRSGDVESMKGEIWDRIATCQNKQGQYKEAVCSWREALEVKDWPSDERAAIEADIQNAEQRIPVFLRET